jgi:hypothetical protein
MALINNCFKKQKQKIIISLVFFIYNIYLNTHLWDSMIIWDKNILIKTDMKNKSVPFNGCI